VTSNKNNELKVSVTQIRKKLHKALSFKKGMSKMLMKLSPGDNFINISETAFVPIFLYQKIVNPNFREKLQKTLSYE